MRELLDGESYYNVTLNDEPEKGVIRLCYECFHALPIDDVEVFTSDNVKHHTQPGEDSHCWGCHSEEDDET